MSNALQKSKAVYTFGFDSNINIDPEGNLYTINMSQWVFDITACYIAMKDA